ncbi:cation:proton antiporter [Planctomycetota bacterium]|nr:cation:proton antiporter [Planctomycetota bacterium]
MEENLLLAKVAMMVGLLVAVSVVARATLARVGVPSIIGYLALGFGLRLIDDRLGFMGVEHHQALRFLAELGVIALLFRVGLEANLQGLVRQLGTAWPIWIGNVIVSGGFGFAVARWGLGAGLMPSLVVATALTATSVAIPSAVWKGAGKLKSREGQLFLDVAVLDDISGIALMALLFGFLPALEHPGEESLLLVLGAVGLKTAVQFALFGGACFLFAVFVEPRVTSFCKRLRDAPDPMLIVFSIGIIIAGFGEVLGTSVAIGAFFAGLAFSRDAKTIRVEASFEPVYELLTPFFFIVLSYGMSPASLASAGIPAIALLAAAVVGKVFGAGGPALLRLPASSALVLGVSMVPRAEIGLLIVERGHRLGAWAVPDQIYAAVVAVGAATCLIAPVVLTRLLKNSTDRGEHVTTH